MSIYIYIYLNLLHMCMSGLHVVLNSLRFIVRSTCKYYKTQGLYIAYCLWFVFVIGGLHPKQRSVCKYPTHPWSVDWGNPFARKPQPESE